MLLHTTFGFTQDRAPWNNPLQNGFGSKFGFNLKGDPDATPYISFATDNLQAFGMNQGKVNNGYQYNRTYHFSQQLTCTRGKHEFKMGWDIRRLATPYDDRAGQNGSYIFSRIQTALPTAQSTTGNAFASFLLGAPNTGTQGDSSYTPGNIRYGYHAGFFQDTWRVTPRLTLDLGFRYEVPIGWHMADGNYTTLNPTLPNAAADGLPGAFDLRRFGRGPHRPEAALSDRLVRHRSARRLRVPSRQQDRHPGGLRHVLPDPRQRAVAVAPMVSTAAILRPETGSTRLSIGMRRATCRRQSGYKPPPRIDPTFLNYGVVYYQGPNYGKAPRVYNWSFTIQHEFKRWLFETAYVGNRGHGLNSTVYMNTLPVSALSLGFRPHDQAFQHNLQSAVLEFRDRLGQRRHRGTVPASLPAVRDHGPRQRRCRPDLVRLVAEQDRAPVRQFERDGELGMVQEPGYVDLTPDLQPGLQCPRRRMPITSKDAKSLMNMDIPNFVNILVSYQLPVGKGKRFLSSAGRAMDLIIGGWNVSGTQQYRSGTLLQVMSATNQLASTTFSPLQKAIATGSPIRSGVSSKDLDPDNPNIRWFNYGANAPYTNAPAYTFGHRLYLQHELPQPLVPPGEPVDREELRHLGVRTVHLSRGCVQHLQPHFVRRHQRHHRKRELRSRDRCPERPARDHHGDPVGVLIRTFRLHTPFDAAIDRRHRAAFFLKSSMDSEGFLPLSPAATSWSRGVAARPWRRRECRGQVWPAGSGQRRG